MGSEHVYALDRALDVQKLLNCDGVEQEDCSLYPFMAHTDTIDTWKRFELLPTPPLSPGCTDFEHELGFLSTDGWDPGSDLLPGSDTLELVSEFLREQEEQESAEDFINDLLAEGSTVVPGLRQDCMWSAFDAREQAERATAAAVEQRRRRPEAAQPPSLVHEEPAVPPPDTGLAAPATPATPTTPSGSEPCFPEPLSPRVMEPPIPSTPSRFSPCPSQTETEPPTDSEEEIDVVTVDKRQPTPSRRRTPCSVAVNTNTAGTRPARCEPWGAVRHGCHIPIHQQHNYAAPSPPSPPPVKRPRWGASSPAAAAAASRFAAKPRPSAERWGSRGPSSASSSSSSGGSDTEESERRRTHNILERQRRDGLRSSFVTLRDSVPELRANERAAKVLILRKAAELARSLGTDERRLEVEKCRQEARRRHLLSMLDKLKKFSS
ncbi:N-myc proto-oncogene protein-like isoform X2 [Petromyzon marinus]|uniref:N-myc proto-oncogene protein-like isoform X2 n=1 Tax=Petromyzon marinus TaxID=7757 RepID=A0AAJ7X1M7_PETMA|nr:N-myc proto-oncogene protein-like isoform X2 [Petromyzon marinus]